jgi:tRNA threonylcarbamoyladenosine biosynthesis protein TsaE
MQPIIVQLPDPAATDVIGQKLASCLAAGQVVTLSGELGAGKTSLVRAMLRACGVTGPVKSPSYALVEVYALSNLYLYHFDFYRFSDPQEWEAAGFREYFRNDSICLIEWPEKASGFLPRPALSLALEICDAGRRLAISAHDTRLEACLARLTLNLP